MVATVRLPLRSKFWPASAVAPSPLASPSQMRRALFRGAHMAKSQEGIAIFTQSASEGPSITLQSTLAQLKYSRNPDTRARFGTVCHSASGRERPNLPSSGPATAVPLKST